MQIFIYTVVAIQIIALITVAVYLPVDKQEFEDWVKRVCN